jgi:hypothetical protein
VDPGYSRDFARPSLVERGEGRGRMGASFLHAVFSDELLRQQRLKTLQVIVGMLKLRFHPGDLGVGNNRIHLPAHDVGREVDAL